jgi:hypothetical protein
MFRFPKELYGNGEQPLSFIAAAVKAMKHLYGIGDDEIRVYDNVVPAGSDEAGPYQYVAVYDADGNGSLPFAKIFKEFEQIIRQAVQNVETCTQCLHGCLLCLRSFNCRFRSARITKRDASDFGRYLLGELRLKPRLRGSANQILSSRVLRIQWRRPRLRFSSGRFRDGVEQAGHIYTSIAKEIQGMTSNGSAALEVVLDGLDWLVDIINGQKAPDKDLDEFRLLLFQLLRYHSVQAVKGKWQ